jgi:hypothetical protein
MRFFGAMALLFLSTSPLLHAQQWHQGYQYVHDLNSFSFSDAKQRCWELGGQLVTPVDKQANDFIISILPDPTVPYWIGAVRIVDQGPFQYVDNSSFNIQSYYTGCNRDVDCLWECDEPIDQVGNCVVIGQQVGVDPRSAWHVFDCNQAAAALCQIPGQF